MSKNPHIGIVVGSTRQGRFSERAAAWFHKIAARRTDLSVEIVDLRDYPMPFFDEPASPAWMPPKDPVAERWAAKLAELDGFVFVTPEYNHGYSAVLKNALDYAFQQFNRKPAAFVGYGGVGAARAIEQLRMVAVELQMAPIPKSVNVGTAEFPGSRARLSRIFRISNRRRSLCWMTCPGGAAHCKPGVRPHPHRRQSTERFRSPLSPPARARNIRQDVIQRLTAVFAVSGPVKGDWS
jgi:NAD(P)H-dependent FMN reductase